MGRGGFFFLSLDNRFVVCDAECNVGAAAADAAATTAATARTHKSAFGKFFVNKQNTYEARGEDFAAAAKTGAVFASSTTIVATKNTREGCYLSSARTVCCRLD